MANEDKGLFNIDLLVVTDAERKYLGEVTNLNIFKPNTKLPDERGLFSTLIFGEMGSESRISRLGIIDLKVTIFHPLIYKHIIYINKLYEGILSGNKKAIFSKEEEDFIEDNKGETGFEFFMANIDKVDLDKYLGKSKQTDEKVQAIKIGVLEHKRLRYHIVLPAGLRDYHIDKNDRLKQDEVNDLYRRLIAGVNVIRNNKITKDNIESYNAYRYKIQNIALTIYLHIFNIVRGKKGYTQGKWASRAVSDGTRNVITTNTTQIKSLKDKNRVGFNHTTIGIYQYAKAVGKVTQHSILKKFITGILNPFSTTGKVIDKKTMKTTMKTINPRDKNAWLTTQGLNTMINKLKQDIMKDEYVTIGEDYLALIYDKGRDIYLIKDTNDLPDDVDNKKLRPITYGELVYISLFDTTDERGLMVTRYPSINVGSIYPSYPYLKTTIVGREIDLHIGNEKYHLYEYPNIGNRYVNSNSVNQAHLEKLDGDHDGDQINANATQTKESKDEIDKLLKSRNYYISPDGSLTYSVNTSTLDLVVRHLTDTM